MTPQAYNGLFTIHGIVMIFLFVAPFGIGLANYLIPLQIGAPDMAFPRLNALSYWFFVGGGLLVLLSGFASAGGGAQTGWYMYAPLSGLRYSPGVGPDLLILGLALVAISTLLSGVNVITTTFLMRAPGMTMWRLPIFTWNMVVTSILGLVAFPPALAAFVLLLFDRRLGGLGVRSARGRRPDHLPAPVLVPRAPGGLHPDPAVLRGDHRDHPGLQPQAAVRLHGVRAGDARDRRAVHRRVGPPHVHDRARSTTRSSAR